MYCCSSAASHLQLVYKLLIAVGFLLLPLPPLFFALYLFHVDVVGYVKSSFILGLAFAGPLLAVAAIVAAVITVGTIIGHVRRQN